MNKEECPACGMDGLEEIKCLDVEVKAPYECTFRDSEYDCCVVEDIVCDGSSHYPEQCPLKTNDGVLVKAK
jgi:hypothetical protein